MNNQPELSQLNRAQGCLLGQLAGDSLGSLVEFQGPDEIRRQYPSGVRELAPGGTWDTLAGQPTDDSEMALALARVLVAREAYDLEAAREAYVAWINSGPFDSGQATRAALKAGRPSPTTQANGALMRISPLGIFGARHDLARVAEWAQADAGITHPHPVCRQASALFAVALAHAIRTGADASGVYACLTEWAARLEVAPSVQNVLQEAQTAPPEDFVFQQGWVLIAFHNAVYQLLHAPGLEAGVVDTVRRGGDTDTNGAIAGALLGAVYGRDAIPEQWATAVLTCRPKAGQPGVRRPRPAHYWPVEALSLAERLLAGPANGQAAPGPTPRP